MSEYLVDNVENDNFRTHHHRLRLKASDNDVFVRASHKRKCAAHFYHASLSLLDNEGTCQIWEEKVLPCIALVDDRSERGINNYAGSALALTAHAGSADVAKWESNLRKSRPVLDIVKKLTDCKNKCNEWKITDEDLSLVLKNSDDEKQNDEKHPSELIQDNTAPRPYNCGSTSINRSKSFPTAIRQRMNDVYTTNHIENVPGNGIIDSSKTSVGVCDKGSNKLRSVGGFPKPGDMSLGVSNHENSTNVRGGMFGGGNIWPESEDCLGRSNSFVGQGMNPPSKGRGIHIKNQNNHENDGDLFKNSLKTCPKFGGSFSSSTIRVAHNPNHWNNTSNLRSDLNMSSKMISPSQPDVEMSSAVAGIFRTAKEELTIQNQKKYGSRGGCSNVNGPSRGGVAGVSGVQKRSLGTARRAGVHGKFVPPVRPTDEDDFGGMFGVKQPQMEGESMEEIDERLKNIDPKMVETIRNEIMDIGAPVTWDDIAGLEFAKSTIQEIVVWPLLRPDIFTGLRKPPKGLLLFGPPGTGKTLIGKCIASQSQSTFFSISASSLTSKWIGDGEKMVRALFAVARVHQPSVVFIDEIDSLLTQRSDTEHESSRRIKTEFLVQLDGAATGDEERILVVGATNRPQELDEAARRRLVKRLYIPLPEYAARRQIVERLMSSEQCALTNKEIDEIASLTEGYSGADMKNLCQEASLGPIRSISFSAMHQITAEQVRPICIEDFRAALRRVRASVSNKDLDAYVQWDKTYGMGCNT